MASLQDVARLASERIGAVIDRARPVARGVALLASACGGLAYLVGALVLHGGWRIGWLVVGVLICFAPAWALWAAFSRLRRATAALPTTAAQLQALTTDRTVRDALYELVERGEDTETTPILTLGRGLNRLRKAVSGHRKELTGLWETITAVTTLPALMAFGLAGSFGLLIFSVVAVLIGLAVR
jgi:hypothetical protein